MDLYRVVFSSRKSLLASDYFIYSSDQELNKGDLVSCPFGKGTANGIVFGREVETPKFKVRPVQEVLLRGFLTKPYLSLVEWLSKYYSSPPGMCLELVAPQKVINRIISGKKTEPKLKSAENVKKSVRKKIKLTEQQKLALAEFQSSSRPLLLHGETGSGKTEVYLEAAVDTLESSNAVLVLVPEIGLTTQAIERFHELGYPVLEVHSNQTELSRIKVWLEVQKRSRTKEPFILIGPRSALFYPVNNLGLIVVDEFHDQAYKQDSGVKYNAVYVAGRLAKLKDAKLIFGSATPNIADYSILSQVGANIIKLNKRIDQRTKVKVIDTRDKAQFKKSHIFTEQLLLAIDQAAQKKEQVLIFHNRRGTARAQSCSKCDWINSCPNCFLPLIFHKDEYILRCHSCSFKSKPRLVCPECTNATLNLIGYGTKHLVDELEKMFPSLKVVRFDTDNIRKKDKLENNYDKIKAGQFDVLVGTQMLAKGLDLPNLSLVGVVGAEGGLLLPDYRSSERTFQLISQVIGRVGRGHIQGLAIVQSAAPEHPAIVFACSGQYSNFYEAELEHRKLSLDSPYKFELAVSFKYTSTERAELAGSSFLREVKTLAESDKVQTIGPAPAFRERAGKFYRYQIILKSSHRDLLQKIAQEKIPAGWSFDLDPLNLI